VNEPKRKQIRIPGYDYSSPGASAPTGASIPDAIGAWKRLVHREVGEKIFRRSYHDHVIRNEEDFREIWDYIDTNPARWAEDRFYTE